MEKFSFKKGFPRWCRKTRLTFAPKSWRRWISQHVRHGLQGWTATLNRKWVKRKKSNGFLRSTVLPMYGGKRNECRKTHQTRSGNCRTIGMGRNQERCCQPSFRFRTNRWESHPEHLWKDRGDENQRIVRVVVLHDIQHFIRPFAIEAKRNCNLLASLVLFQMVMNGESIIRASRSARTARTTRVARRRSEIEDATFYMNI